MIVFIYFVQVHHMNTHESKSNTKKTQLKADGSFTVQ